ncbi:hypothetical protein CKF43_10335 [Pantoea graminicola]|uniref:hypothetical protein n=1 Tax=unclassified Pantoea TaxID=2630326 RepID=UPI000DA72980|nr:hypothetical protein [Pantoea sp. ARC607]PZL94820.1 hypothetical protein CKF43_10335 [Pantoea sp. ARC607]
MLIVPASYSAEAVECLYEVIDNLTLNGSRCQIIYDSQAARAAVIEADATDEHGEQRHPVLAVLEMERVTSINTILRIKSFWTDADGTRSNVEQGSLAKALYKALTLKKQITLVGL